MAFIPAPNCASVDLIYTVAESKCENVFHVKADTPFSLTDLALLSEVFIDWYGTSLAPNVSSSVSLTKVVVAALDNQFAPGLEVTTDLPIAGGNNSPILPKNVSLAVKWGTGLRGRSYRGRTFIVGMTEDMVTGDQVSAPVATAFRDAFLALLTALDSTPWDLVVLSKYEGNAPRTTAVATEIASVSVDTTVDSQRRRLSGRGA